MSASGDGLVSGVAHASLAELVADKLRLYREALVDIPACCDVALQAVRSAATARGAVATVLRQRAGGGADVLVRFHESEKPQVELRCAVVGNVDAGKSTLVSVLTTGRLDDGRGAARGRVFRHAHEVESGRTSSVSQVSMFFSFDGRLLVDESSHRGNACDVSSASKCINLVDLAGHERYLKTTCFGITAHMPDYAIVLVGANAGLVGMCKEHVGIALALKVPACYVVTKIDMAPAEVTKATLADLSAVLKKPGVRKRPFIVRTNDDVFAAAANIASDTMAPIFLVSSVDGRGLDRLRLFLNLLPPRVQWGAREEDPAEFVIDEVFGIPGVGTVVAGTCTAGTISAASSLLLGPDPGDGQFKACAIKSIHYKRVSAKHIVAGQSAAFALKRIKRGAVRKGMVLVSPALSPHAIWEFDAEVAILTHSSTMRPRYQAVVHAGVVRQSAVVVAMSKDLLRSGDRAHVRFRFLQRPEFLASGVRFLFREGRTKGIGVVLPPGGSVPMAEPAAGADAPA